MKNNTSTINSINNLIKPEFLTARRTEVPLKWFYSKVREEKEKNKPIIDIGTSISPRLKEISFFKDPIQKAEEEIKQKNLYFNYSSTWGLLELRKAIINYLFKNYQIQLDPFTEIMITSSVSSAYDKILQAFRWDGILLPSWVHKYVLAQALFYRFPIIKVPINFHDGNLNLKKIEKKLNPKKRWLLIINHPAFPTGLLMDDDFIEEKLFPFCQKYNIFIFSESYFSAKRLDGQPFRPLLSFPQGKDICVEVIGLHRELGTPGIRVCAILGNKEIINILRVVSSLKVDIVPPTFQLIMVHILNYLIEHNISSVSMDDIVKELKKEIIPRLKKMGWPFILPEAGVEMVISVPPRFIRKEIKDPSLFAAFVFLKRYNVVFAPASIVSSTGKRWLIIHLRQKEHQVAEALERMIQNNFHWADAEPKKEEIDSFIKEMKEIEFESLKI